MFPVDHSRVKLLPTDEDESEGGSDYINANYMPVSTVALTLMLWVANLAITK